MDSGRQESVLQDDFTRAEGLHDMAEISSNHDAMPSLWFRVKISLNTRHTTELKCSNKEIRYLPYLGTLKYDTFPWQLTP